MEAIKSDIVKLKVDAIVNAANTSLLGGGGVDGAIHRAAGRELLEECRKLNGCKTGEAKLTKGYKLPARYVIHTAGPVWQGGNSGEAELLTDCYNNSMSIAFQNSFKSIAFPCISAGVYGYPVEAAAYIAVNTVKRFIEKNNFKIEVVFCCYSDYDLNVYKKILERNI